MYGVKRPKNVLIVALCATVLGTRDVSARVTVSCQRLQFVFRLLNRSADSLGHGAANIIVVELQDLQLFQI
jgi:hypothetical protein